MSKTRSLSHENSNTPAIVGGIIGGGGGVICVIGIVAFVQRRRRWAGSILSNSTRNGLQAIVTPFNPIFSEAALESGTSMEPLVSGDPEAEMVSFHGLSSLPPTRARAPQRHTFQLAYLARRLRAYAQNYAEMLLFLNSPTTPCHRTLSLRPPSLRLSPPERHLRRTTLGDYTRKLSLYVARWSDFAQRHSYSRHRRAMLRKVIDSLKSLPTIFVVTVVDIVIS